MQEISKKEEELIKNIEKKGKNKKTNEIVSYGLFTQEDPKNIY